MAPQDKASIKERIAMFSSQSELNAEDLPNVVRIGLNRDDGIFLPRQKITRSEKLSNRKGFIREKLERRTSERPENPKRAPSMEDQSNSLRRMLPTTPESETVVFGVPENDKLPELPSISSSPPIKSFKDRTSVFGETVGRTSLTNKDDGNVTEECPSKTSDGKEQKEDSVPPKARTTNRNERNSSESNNSKSISGWTPPRVPTKSPRTTPMVSAKTENVSADNTCAVPSDSNSSGKFSAGPSGTPPRRPLQRKASLFESGNSNHSRGSIQRKTSFDSSHSTSPPRRTISRKGSFDSACSKVSVIPENVFRRNPNQGKLSRKAPKFSRSDLEGDLILAALKDNFLFKHMSNEQLKSLVSSFERIVYEKGQVIVECGEKEDFVHIVHQGKVEIRDVDGDIVGTAACGETFGELSLISSGRGDTTAIAVEKTVVLRANNEVVNAHLKESVEESEESKVGILQKVAFLKDQPNDKLKILAGALKSRDFVKGDVLVRKETEAKEFFLLKEGTVKVRDTVLGGAEYEPVSLGPGQYFGEEAIAGSRLYASDVVCRSKGTIYTLDAKTFTKVLSKQFKQILKSQDPKKIAGVKALAFKPKPKLDFAQLASLASKTVNKIYKEGKRVVKAGKEVEPALYLIREGTVVITTEDGEKEISSDGYFGFETCPVPSIAPFTATCKSVCVLGVLTLSQMKEVFDTSYMEAPTEDKVEEPEVPVVNIKLEDLQRHQILGEGNFGQVWLSTERGKKVPYALKIQSKFELLEEGQAETVLREKDIMCQLRHPFVSSLVQTYQDKDFLYMLLDFAAGGELFNVIHADDHDHLPEENTKFYACAIADALVYMHRRFIAYRDLKPENIVLDQTGYPIIIDFGYSKYVPENSFTLCGTP